MNHYSDAAVLALMSEIERLKQDKADAWKIIEPQLFTKDYWQLKSLLAPPTSSIELHNCKFYIKGEKK